METSQLASRHALSKEACVNWKGAARNVRYLTLLELVIALLPFGDGVRACARARVVH